MDTSISILLRLQSYLFGLIPLVLTLFVLSQIVVKAGYSRWHIIWLIIPFVNLIAIYHFLWGSWPLEIELARLKGRTDLSKQASGSIEVITHSIGRILLSLFWIVVLLFLIIALPTFLINLTQSELLRQFTPSIVLLFGIMLFVILRYFYLKGKQLS